MKSNAFWLTAVALLAILYHASGQVAFAPGVNYPTGVGPIEIAVADVNGDGKLDLICANYGNVNGTKLTVLTNNGEGIFGSNATLTAASGVGSVIAADINGDGWPDLITASQGGPDDNGDTITIFTNNRNGSLVFNTTLTAGKSVVSLLAVDSRNTGKLDLICANYNDNTLSVFTNNGSGIFGSNATLNVGSSPASVVSVDVNGDGKLDLVCSDIADGTVMVFTNNGHGVFGSNATLTVSGGPCRVRVADFNGDGKPDLIVAGLLGSFFEVFTNDGSGIFVSNSTVNVANNPNWLVTADVNGDGWPDVVCVNTLENTLTVFTNNGHGLLFSNVTLNVGNEPEFVTAADVNGDGKPDLICSNFGNTTGTNLTVLINLAPFPPPAVSPALKIQPSATSVVVSWPSSSPGWSLQQNTDLTKPDWGPGGYNGYPIADNGTNKSLFVTPLIGNLFFRLIHP